MKNINLHQIMQIALISVISMMSLMGQDNTVIQNVVVRIPEVALLDLEGGRGTDIRFTGEGPREAGMAVDFSNQTNNDLWINYSSITNKRTEPSRDITVQITSGNVPAGMVLEVTAGKDAGRGEGQVGVPTGTISVNHTAQSIIRGVGSAYTGHGTSNGHQLSYKLALSNDKGSYGHLDLDQSNTVAIMYTLTDQ
jgi:hypothetical protein